jgi:hypothetical protein
MIDRLNKHLSLTPIPFSSIFHNIPRLDVLAEGVVC